MDRYWQSPVVPSAAKTQRARHEFECVYRSHSSELGVPRDVHLDQRHKAQAPRRVALVIELRRVDCVYVCGAVRADGVLQAGDPHVRTLERGIEQRRVLK
eukprot:4398209-Prymnesium_polylepis.2